MRSNVRLIEYVLAAIIVIILGALAGWYFFLRSQNAATQALDAARGLGTQPPSGSAFGSPSGGILPGFTSAPAAQTPAQLWQVSTQPAAGVGFTLATSTASSSTIIEFVDRATGNVFSADPATGVVRRLTDTLMPKIYQALFLGGTHVIERSLDSAGAVTTFAGAIVSASSTATSSPGSLVGSFLARDITAISADPASGGLFLLIKGAAGVTGIRADWNGTHAKQVFASPLSDWRAYLLGGRVFLAQSAADSAPGYAYELSKSGSLVPLARALPGLVILPKADSSALLFSTSQGGALSLYAQASSTATPALLPVNTTADKCAWAPGAALVAYCAVPEGLPAGDFLDEWYRGQAHSSDAIWKIDAASGTAKLYFTPPSGTSLDVTEPVIDGSGAYLGFLNNDDLTPWVLRLVQ